MKIIRTYNHLHRYVLAARAGDIQNLIIVGESGLSKSWSVRTALDQAQIRYLYFNGRTSPIRCYIEMYDNQHECDLLVFDDVLMKSDDHAELLKAVMEYGPGSTLFEHSRHPYTRGLLRSLPYHQKRRSRFQVIPGQIPDPLSLPAGCTFHPRCDMAIDKCSREEPVFEEVSPGHWSKCHVSREI